MFTLNTYSIPGFSVPAETVKFPVGVTLFDMFSITREFQVRVTHLKSSYAISQPPFDQRKLSSFWYDAPSHTRGVLSTFILVGFNLVAIIF